LIYVTIGLFALLIAAAIATGVTLLEENPEEKDGSDE
jgi:hypothetical protein